MNKSFFAVFISLLFMTSVTHAGLYKWVDAKGEVHFSDKVPVAASRKAVSEINKHGNVTKTVDPEAIAQAKLEFDENTVEREKQESLEQIKQEKIAILKKRDDYLLSTYENKQELMTSFETKIKLIKGNEAILKTQNLVLEKRLVNLNTEKSVTKHKSRKDSIEKKIINISQTIKQYKKALLQNKNERLKLSKNYKVDVQRYIELTK